MVGISFGLLVSWRPVAQVTSEAYLNGGFKETPGEGPLDTSRAADASRSTRKHSVSQRIRIYVCIIHMDAHILLHHSTWLAMTKSFAAKIQSTDDSQETTQRGLPCLGRPSQECGPAVRCNSWTRESWTRPRPRSGWTS